MIQQLALALWVKESEVLKVKLTYSFFNPKMLLVCFVKLEPKYLWHKFQSTMNWWRPEHWNLLNVFSLGCNVKIWVKSDPNVKENYMSSWELNMFYEHVFGMNQVHIQIFFQRNALQCIAKDANIHCCLYLKQSQQWFKCFWD